MALVRRISWCIKWRSLALVTSHCCWVWCFTCYLEWESQESWAHDNCAGPGRTGTMTEHYWRPRPETHHTATCCQFYLSQKATITNHHPSHNNKTIIFAVFTANWWPQLWARRQKMSLLWWNVIWSQQFIMIFPLQGLWERKRAADQELQACGKTEQWLLQWWPLPFPDHQW